MVEKIIQKEDEGKERGSVHFKMPKHIKQMGKGGNNPEIYIEDYAEGYLRRLAGSDYTECRVAVLVGEFVKWEGKRYVFIHGAIEAECVTEENVPRFSSEVWAGVYEKVKRYFPKYEVVGWFLGGPDFLTEVNETIRQTHVDWFGGRDRVLFRVDPVEKNAEIYLYDKDELTLWPGYCIYYEKNEEMQDYLVSGKNASVDAGYKEPILAELGRKVGRKEEEESEAEGLDQEAVKNREPGKKSELPKKEQGTKNQSGMGMVAAAALLVAGAFALRQSRGANNEAANAVGTGIPSPASQGVMATDNIGSFEMVAAGVTLIPTVQPSVGTEENKSVLGRDFIPIEEESYNPDKEESRDDQSEEGKVNAEETGESAEEDKGASVADSMELYIVQNGDTLAGICRKYYGNLSRMEEVKGVNQIPDENWIYAGQELYLP